MRKLWFGMALLVGLLAWSACSTSNTDALGQRVETAKVSNWPVQENSLGKEVVGEKPNSDLVAPKTGGSVGNEAPDFQGISNWINSEPLTMEELRGKVVLVDFWTFACHNCIATMPYLRDWHAKYAEKGLVIVGVHTPEFDFEHDTGNVVNSTVRYGLDYPVAQDNDFDTWDAYSNSSWPAEYLIDQDGIVRYKHFGQGAYEETEKQIRDLLDEIGADLS